MKTANIEKTLHEKGITPTMQRRIIAQTLFSMGKHVGASELYSIVRQKNPGIGFATVYRTLQLLKENGLVEQRDFGDGKKRYERRDETHHDHLVCINCGKVEEFDVPVIERLQEEVAREKGFNMVDHRLELYGYCKKCREEKE
ncbi:MAG: transcriptional repressor [Spirochaetes bacterium]|nr:MAG: transcriptional repressor [Spirochaetota bacterium]